MNGDKTLEKLASRAASAEEMINVLRRQIVEVRRAILGKCLAEETGRLQAENASLRLEVDRLKGMLIEAENRNGVKQISVPVIGVNGPLLTGDGQTLPAPQRSNKVKSDSKPSAYPVVSRPTSGATTSEGGTGGADVAEGPSDKGKSPKSAKVVSGAKGPSDPDPDVSRLDLRVGVIVSAAKHPDADSLYVEDVDVGNGDRRTVVSGLVRFVPLAEMQNKMAVFLCNLKPAKMRGVLSQAMIMCASTPDKVEMLMPPPGCVPGDRVVVEGFAGRPDAELNPKKKIFEQLAPDLKVSGERVATYKGVPWTVPGKGVVVAPSLDNVKIK